MRQVCHLRRRAFEKPVLVLRNLPILKTPQVCTTGRRQRADPSVGLSSIAIHIGWPSLSASSELFRSDAGVLASWLPIDISCRHHLHVGGTDVNLDIHQCVLNMSWHELSNLILMGAG